MADQFVGLIRVSTERQGQSGLGLEAGLADLMRYIEGQGGELVEVFTEVESGTHDDLVDRPTLLKALALCKRRKAILLVPKTDRLTRSTQAHADLKRSGVRFRAVDNPHANEFTVDILVAVAANEARAISTRTKAALAAYKARGGVLGARPGQSPLTAADRAKGRARANARQAAEATEVYCDLIPTMRAARAEGLSLAAIADQLNSEGNTTRSGTPWRATQVKRTLDRAGTQ